MLSRGDHIWMYLVHPPREYADHAARHLLDDLHVVLAVLVLAEFQHQLSELSLRQDHLTAVAFAQYRLFAPNRECMRRLCINPERALLACAGCKAG